MSLASTSPPSSSQAHLTSGRARRAVFGALWSSLNTIVPALATTLIFILSSRLLTPFDFGVVALAASVVSVATGLAPASFADALIQRDRITPAHTHSVFWLCALTGAVFYAALLIGAPFIAMWLEEPMVANLLPLLGLKVLFDLCGAVPGALIARAMRYHVFAIRTAIATLISGAACVTLLLLDYGLWALAISQLIASFVNVVAGFWAAGWWPSLRPRFDGLRDILRFGLFASGNRLLHIANIDQLAIGALGGAPMLGVFVLAARLHAMVQDLLSGALSSVSYTFFSSLQNEREKTAEAYYVILYTSVALALPAFAGLALVVADFTPLVLGEKWTPAILPVQAFCIMGAASAIINVDAALVNARGKPDWWFAFLLVEKLSALVLIAFAIPHGLGAVMACLMLRTVCFSLPVTVAMSLRLIGGSPWRHITTLAAPVCATLAMAAVVLSLPYLNTAPVLTLLLQVTLGGLTYAAVLLPLSRARIRYLITVFRHRQEAPT